MVSVRFVMHLVLTLILDLHKLHGFEPILQLLRDPSPVLRMWAAWIVATVAQNNPEGQKKAIELGALPEVIELFQREQEDKVIAKALLALSALVKDNDTTLAKFLSEGGLKALASVLSPAEHLPLTTPTKMKTVFFLTHIFRHDSSSRDAFREIGALEYLLPLLKDEDMDLREKTLLALMELLQNNRTNAKACIKLNLHSVCSDPPPLSAGSCADSSLFHRSCKNE